MDKTLLRDKLFCKYFECTDGILMSDLLDKLSYIPETWHKLHILCQSNIPFSSLYACKLVEYNKNKYLILNIGFWRYVIIDVNTKENITKEQFKSNFDEEFFIKNFGERKEKDEKLYSILYDLDRYNGDIDQLLNFYLENKDVLCLSTELNYKFKIDNALTNFHVDFTNARANMVFLTPDQFLYEHLFFNYDLTPCSMQDAGEKIGIEKMYEIFDKIKDIRIPIECIPNDLYQEYLNQCNKKYKIRYV